MKDNTNFISAEEFLAHLERREIPPRPLVGTSPNGFGAVSSNMSLESQFTARARATDFGMWAIVDRIWTGELAAWIGDRRVLEIMAGAGWLARALSEHGVDITATDNFSSHQTYPKERCVFDIKKMGALKAVRSIEADILLASWPPYKDAWVSRACAEWGSEKPIVYVGEGRGGCNATDGFFDGFVADERAPKFSLRCWWGIHDAVQIGRWKVRGIK